MTRGGVDRVEFAAGSVRNKCQVHDERTSPTRADRSIWGSDVSYESHAEPIKLGYLFDFKLPDSLPDEMRKDLTRPFELVFREGLEQGLIDRPVEIVYREVEGLPKGTIKAVIDAYGELVDEGCLVVFGPAITDNTVPTKEAIEERFHVPAMSMTGTEEWLGEWTFALPQGSMTDEPIFWADLIAEGRLHDRRRAHRAVAGRRLLHPGLPQRLCAARHPDRRRGVDPSDGAGHRQAGARVARREAAGHRALRLRLRDRVREPGARRARLGSASLHGHRLPERVGQPDHVERDPRMDRARPVRRGATRSARPSSTGTRPSTAVARRTACRS